MPQAGTILLSHGTSRLARTCVALVMLLAACNLPLTPIPGTRYPRAQGSTPPPANELLAVPSEYLSGIRIASHDPLENARNWRFEQQTGTLVNGVIQLRGTPFWQSHLAYRPAIKEGQGILVIFGAQQANAESELVLVDGDWLTGDFRQFGLYNAVRPQADLFQGANNLGGYAVMGNLTMRPNTWYSFVLAAGRNGRFLALMWDPANPASRAVFDLAAGMNWTGRTWTFLPKANDGETLFINDLYRLTFSDVR